MQSSVTTNGRITIPADLRKRFGLRVGQEVTFVATAEGILVKPVRTDRLTRKPAWKKALEASLLEAETGKTRFFGSGDEFLAALQCESKKADHLRNRR